MRRLQEQNIQEESVVPEESGENMGDSEFAARGLLGEPIAAESIDPKNDPNIALEEVAILREEFTHRTSGIPILRRTWTFAPRITFSSLPNPTRIRGPCAEIA